MSERREPGAASAAYRRFSRAFKESTMDVRALLLIVLATGSGCGDLPFLSHDRSSSTGAAADGGSSDGVAAADAGSGSISFPGFETVDAAANSSNATEGVALDNVDPGAFSIPLPWKFDAGAPGDALPFSFPAPASLPPASVGSTALALSLGGDTDVGVAGCGEPPSCYLRTIVATADGHVYSARLSKSYPNDSCVTKTIECDHAVLVGDSNARFGDATCGPATPRITLGFLVPQSLFFSWQSGQVWESTSGFRSEWTLADAGDDSGTYEPVPGQVAKLWPVWTRFFAGGEIYGELLVPLRNAVTHTTAIGFALFDIRVRR